MSQHRHVPVRSFDSREVGGTRCKGEDFVRVKDGEGGEGVVDACADEAVEDCGSEDGGDLFEEGCGFEGGGGGGGGAEGLVDLVKGVEGGGYGIGAEDGGYGH